MARGTAASAEVAIDLSGGCTITTPGGTLDRGDLSGPRAEIAFARLALAHGAPVSRDALAEALWGDNPPRSWRPALRNVIAHLRSALDAGGVAGVIVLETAGDGYRLTLPAATTIDIEALEPAATRAETAAVLGDHAGALRISSAALARTPHPVLAGARGEWVDALRADVGRCRDRLVRIAGEAALALGDHAEAERLGRQLVRNLPLREDGYRLLMRALNAAGNPAEALAAYDDCRRVLEEALGAVPSEATQTLFLGILRDQRAESRVTPGAGRMLLLDRQTPFVGRREVLDRLTAALHDARARGPSVVAVGGEPGLGKTRLAAALARRAHDAGVSTLYGRADDRIAAPYGPFLESIDGYFASMAPSETTALLGRHSGALSRLVPSIAAVADPPEPSGSPDLDQLHLAAALVHALRVIARAGGGLLVLDDMQWASRAARALVDSLAAGTGGGDAALPLLVVALHRPVEGLFADDVESLELQPLTIEDVAELARLQADRDGDGDGEAAEWVWRESGGNALLATELLAADVDGAGERPARIDEIVRARLAQLPRETEEVLRIAALAGLEFDPQIVAAASSAGGDAVAAALEQARDARLLVDAIGWPGRLAFRHGLVRASLLEAVGAGTGMRMHQRLAEALERSPEGGASHAALAYHFGAAAPLGDWRGAVRYGLPVARAAFETGFHEDAVAVARRTLATLAAAGDPDHHARLDLEIVAGSAERALGDPRGHETLNAAFAGAAALGDGTRMADAALGFTQAGVAVEAAHIDDIVLPLYEQALAALPAHDVRRRAVLLARIACGYIWQRDGRLARAARKQAQQMALTLSDDETLSRVHMGIRQSLVGMHVRDEQWTAEDALLDIAARRDDPRGRARALLWRFETSLESGDGDRLAELLDEAGALNEGLPDAAFHHAHAYLTASLEIVRGDVERADRAVEHAAHVGRERGIAEPIVESVRQAQLIGVRKEQGRLADLRQDVLAFLDQMDVPAWRLFAAWLGAEVGEMDDDLEEHVDAVFADFARYGARQVMPVLSQAQLARTIELLADTEKAATQYLYLLPYAGRIGALTPLLSTDHALGVLARMLGRDDDARRHFTDGIAFANRLGAPLIRSMCEAELSV